MTRGKKKFRTEKAIAVTEENIIRKLKFSQIKNPEKLELAKVAFVDAKLRFSSKEDYTAKSSRRDVSAMVKDFMDIYGFTIGEAFQVINKAAKATRKSAVGRKKVMGKKYGKEDSVLLGEIEGARAIKLPLYMAERREKSEAYVRAYVDAKIRFAQEDKEHTIKPNRLETIRHLQKAYGLSKGEAISLFNKAEAVFKKREKKQSAKSG
jgi:hypothetical protein